MPTYEYQCKQCNHTFEEFQPMSAPALTTCPSCSEDALVRMIGVGAGVIFKGSGFYATDYRRHSKQDGKEQKETKSDTKASDSCTTNPETCPKCGPDS